MTVCKYLCQKIKCRIAICTDWLVKHIYMHLFIIKQVNVSVNEDNC